MFTLIQWNFICAKFVLIRNIHDKLNVLERLYPVHEQHLLFSYFLKAFKGQQNQLFGSGCFQGSQESKEIVSITRDLH